jgi:hypothetical protein
VRWITEGELWESHELLVRGGEGVVEGGEGSEGHAVHLLVVATLLRAGLLLLW